MNTLLIARRRLIAASCVMSLVGCSMIGNPPPQMYRLSPTDVDPPDGPPVRHSSLAIDTPTAPENLDSERIALTRGTTRFAYFADATWTDRVPALLRTLLVEAFEATGRIADVWTESDGMSDGYLLQTQIRAFTARYDEAAASPPVVDVSLDLRLVRLPGQRTVGRTLIAEQSTAARNELSSVVPAFDAATAKALSRSVTWTLQVMQS
jgi:cholesterol transport system auxiliary component